MEPLFKSFRFSITVKLLFLNLMIFVVLGIIIGIMVLGFENITRLTDSMINENVTQVVQNAQLKKEFSGIFDRIQLLIGTFYRNEKRLKIEKDYLTKQTRIILNLNMNKDLRYAAQEFNAGMKSLLSQCDVVNQISKTINRINDNIAACFLNLDEILSERIVTIIMEGKDPSVTEQNLEILPSYKENLLKISFQFILLDPMRATSEESESVLTLLEDFRLRIRTLLVSEPDIAEQGKKILHHISEYKNAVIKFNNAMIELRGQIMRANRIKENIMRIMQSLDNNIANQFDLMRKEITNVMQFSLRFVYTMAGLAITLITIVTYVFFLINIRKPMELIWQGLESIGDGNLDTRIRLNRKDEWNAIGEALNRMVSEIWHSYSELYHKNEELRESEERLNRAQAVAHVGNWELELPAKRVWGSNEAFRIYGLPRQTPFLPFEQIEKSVHSKDRQRMNDALDRLIQKKEKFDEIIRISRTNDNEERIIHFRAEVLHDEKGVPLKVLGTVQDITELKQTEGELNKTRLYLNRIVDSMPSVLIGIDPSEYVTLWNVAAEKETGISCEQAIGKNLRDIFPQYSRFVDEMNLSMKKKQPLTKEKIPQQYKEQTRHLNMMIYPLFSNGSDGAVLRIDDVTEKVRLEEMMIQTEKMMSVGGLAAGMAHEINNPLGVILQGIQNTFRRLSPELKANITIANECGTDLDAICCYLEKRGITDYLNGIKDAGSRAARIVSNMLNFSRRTDSKMIVTDIAKLLDNTIDLAANDYDLKKKYDFRHIEIIRDYTPELTQIVCTPTEIEQVILNLLKNAAQAISEIKDKKDNPKIILRTRKEPKYLRIEVEDNGPGMDEKTCTRIFEPFYTTKSVGIGTGLGLSVSFFIITNNHKGTMFVESEPGKGAKFIIRLPEKAVGS